MTVSTDAVWWLLAGLFAGFAAGFWFARRRRRGGRAHGAATPTTAAPAEPPAPPSYVDVPTRPPPMRTIDVAAARAAGFNLRHAEDLTVIEGLGRHAEELLRSHDITSFAQLARRQVADLHAILEDGGPHFQYTQPAAWPREALLASENRWAELKALHAARVEEAARRAAAGDESAPPG